MKQGIMHHLWVLSSLQGEASCDYRGCCGKDHMLSKRRRWQYNPTYVSNTYIELVASTSSSCVHISGNESRTWDEQAKQRPRNHRLALMLTLI